MLTGLIAPQNVLLLKKSYYNFYLVVKKNPNNVESHNYLVW